MELRETIFLALLVGVLFQKCQGVCLTSVTYKFNEHYPIYLEKQGVTAVTCKSPQNCEINGFKDGCLVDIRFPSKGKVEFKLTDVLPDELKLSTSNTRNGLPLSSTDNQTISAEAFRNQMIPVKADEGLLLFCASSDSVGLEHPGPDNSHSSTIVHCQKEGQCKVNNKKFGIESTRIPCNCHSTAGQCFFFPHLDESRHVGFWMCRHYDTGAVPYVNLVFNDPSKKPRGGVTPSSSSSASNKVQQSILTTIVTATLILWSLYKYLFN